jgi:hypothetical protein
LLFDDKWIDFMLAVQNGWLECCPCQFARGIPDQILLCWRISTIPQSWRWHRQRVSVWYCSDHSWSLHLLWLNHISYSHLEDESL